MSFVMCLLLMMLNVIKELYLQPVILSFTGGIIVGRTFELVPFCSGMPCLVDTSGRI